LALNNPLEGNQVKADKQKELEWIEEAREKPEAFRTLFDAYYDRIFNYILRRVNHVQMAKDIAANTFLQAMKHIQQFQWHGISFSAWLYKIATNEIKQNYRKTKRFVYLSEEHLHMLKSDSQADAAVIQTETDSEKMERSRKVRAAIASLKLIYQSTLMLRYYENMSIKEISEILDMPESTVKTHIRRGLIQLRNRL